MRQQGRTSPRTPYSTEYRNRKGFSETIQDHAERLKNVELRAGGTPGGDGPRTLEVYKNGFRVGAENILDLIEGANVTLTVTDDGIAIRVEIAATGTGGSGYDTVEDEGAPLTQRDTIDFVGAGVTAADAGGKTVVTIPGGSSTGYDTIEDEGTPLAQETVIDFQGAGVTATAGVGKTIVTIPGGSSSGGGVVAYDAVTDLNYLGVDGDPTTLATDSIVYRFATIQAAIDAWDLGDMPTVSSPLVLLINKGDYSSEAVVVSNAGAVVMIGTPGRAMGFAPGGQQAPVVVLGSLMVINQSETYRLEGIETGDLTVDASAVATTGMIIEARRCNIHNVLGGLTNSLLEDCSVPTGWQLDVGQTATDNILTRFNRVYFGGNIGTLDDLDHELAGVYEFDDSDVASGIVGNVAGLKVATDKHFAFRNGTRIGNALLSPELNFNMDGGVLTLDLDGVRFLNGSRIVITDAGGGGTVIINWSGGSVEQTAAPVIEADATIVVTGSVDGVALLGTPNSPAFKGQFVDFAFGDAITPPSYVVEFL